MWAPSKTRSRRGLRSASGAWDYESVPTRELLELVDELDRSAERDEMTARDPTPRQCRAAPARPAAGTGAGRSGRRGPARTGSARRARTRAATAHPTALPTAAAPPPLRPPSRPPGRRGRTPRPCRPPPPRPPTRSPSTTRGRSRLPNHRVDQDQQLDRHALADERRGEAAHRLRDEHDRAAVADCLDDGVGVLGEPGARRQQAGPRRSRSCRAAPARRRRDASTTRPRRPPGLARMLRPCTYDVSLEADSSAWVRAGRVYSTAEGDLRKASDPRAGRRTAPPTPDDGIVRVSQETSCRRGKTVTVARGIPPGDLQAVASDLKRQCGSGGAAKDSSSRSRVTIVRRSSPASSRGAIA